ncbi:MAG: type 2 isopentenyl-diphosphate Delta-isomerase, partial [bacterium]
MSIASRKKEHIKICLKEDVRFKKKTTGLEKYDFIHCALPEINLKDIDTSITLFGKKLSFPFFIGSLTGGWKGAVKINKSLAHVCESEGIGLEVGSQRSLLKGDEYIDSYRIIREIAPHSLVIGNIGALQTVQYPNIGVLKKLMDIVRADAFSVHINPLQEVLQAEGEFNFKGILAGIERLVKSFSIPIIVKEVGCGISTQVAQQLAHVGVSYINIAGAGGTSWAGVESLRNKRNLPLQFWDWGIPTAKSITMVSKVRGIKIIASGGLTNGIDMAKTLALGAVCCSAALPVLRKLNKKGIKGVVRMIRQWKEELTLSLFLTGSSNIQAVRR